MEFKAKVLYRIAQYSSPILSFLAPRGIVMPKQWLLYPKCQEVARSHLAERKIFIPFPWMNRPFNGASQVCASLRTDSIENLSVKLFTPTQTVRSMHEASTGSTPSRLSASLLPCPLLVAEWITPHCKLVPPTGGLHILLLALGRMPTGSDPALMGHFTLL